MSEPLYGVPRKPRSNCLKCGKIKDMGYIKGKCMSCYSYDLYRNSDKFKEYQKRRNARNRIRYANDPEFRKKNRASSNRSAKKRYHRRMLEDKTWNARKQKDYREKFPDNFHSLHARYHLRRLPLDRIYKVFREILIEKEKEKKK